MESICKYTTSILKYPKCDIECECCTGKENVAPSEETVEELAVVPAALPPEPIQQQQQQVHPQQTYATPEEDEASEDNLDDWVTGFDP